MIFATRIHICSTTIRKNVCMENDMIVLCKGLLCRRSVSFAYNLDYYCLSAEWVTDMGLLKYSDV